MIITIIIIIIRLGYIVICLPTTTFLNAVPPKRRPTEVKDNLPGCETFCSINVHCIRIRSILQGGAADQSTGLVHRDIRLIHTPDNTYRRYRINSFAPNPMPYVSCTNIALTSFILAHWSHAPRTVVGSNVHIYMPRCKSCKRLVMSGGFFWGWGGGRRGGEFHGGQGEFDPVDFVQEENAAYVHVLAMTYLERETGLL